MARLALSPIVSLGSYPSLPLSAGAADFAFTPAGASYADGFSFPLTGRELLIVHNGNVGAQTVTLDSVPANRTSREGDVSAYSLAADDYAIFGPFAMDGWEQSDGNFHGEGSATDVEFAVLKW